MQVPPEPKRPSGGGDIPPVPTIDQKKFMKVGELVLLVVELRKALALERGGGSPISTKEYLELDQRAKDAVYGIELS